MCTFVKFWWASMQIVHSSSVDICCGSVIILTESFAPAIHDLSLFILDPLIMCRLLWSIWVLLLLILRYSFNCAYFWRVYRSGRLSIYLIAAVCVFLVQPKMNLIASFCTCSSLINYVFDNVSRLSLFWKDKRSH